MTALSTNVSLFSQKTPFDGLSGQSRASAAHVLHCVARRGGLIPSDEIEQLQTDDHSLGDVSVGISQLLSSGLMDVGVAGNSFHLTLAGERQAGL